MSSWGFEPINTGPLGEATMTTTTSKKAPVQSTPPSDSEKAKRLLEEAMKQPGVRELAEVYQSSRRYEEAAAAYRGALCPEPVEWASSSTSACAL